MNLLERSKTSPGAVPHLNGAGPTNGLSDADHLNSLERRLELVAPPPSVKAYTPAGDPPSKADIADLVRSLSRPLDFDLTSPLLGTVPTESDDTSGNRPGSVTIDLERLADAGFVVPGTRRSPMAEQFGQIKRPLLTNARGRDALANRLSLIMVTSALPREGKTFCAANLAMSMSFEIDTSVLLVDADVRRPELLQRLGLEPQRGLLDLLTDSRLRLSDVVLATNIPKLSILPAGLPNNISSELLASDAMDELLLSLAATHAHQVIIFDTPPLLVTTEAKVLASRMGQVVVVVEASSTPRSVLVDAFATVAQCPIVMSVLNKARAPRIPLGYGY